MRVTVHNRGPEAARLHLLPQLWFRNTWSWGRDRCASPACCVGSRRPDRGAASRSWASYVLALRRHAASCCSARTRRIRAGSSATPRPTGYFKDAFTSTWSTATRRPSTRSRWAPRPRRIYELNVPAGGSRRVRLRLCRDRVARRRSPTSTRSLPRGVARPTSSTPTLQTRPDRSRRAARAAAGLGRHDLEQAVLRLRRPRVAARATRRSRRRRRAPARPQSRVAAPQQRRHHLDARQMGVSLVRGLGPGVSLHPAGARRAGVRQGAARAADPRVVHAPQRAAAGLRMGLRRREPAGPCLGGVARVSDRPQAARRPAAIWRSWSACSTSCCSTSPGGSIARTRRAATSSRAASSAWTTSASSTAARRLPTAAIINQADGTSWMAMYCLNLMRIALELALHNPVYEDIATKFFEHFLHIAEAMTDIGGDGSGIGLWDEEDGFFYDELQLARRPDDSAQGPVDGRPDSAVRRRDARAGDAGRAARLQAAAEVVSRTPARPGAIWSRAGTSRARGERRLLSLLRGHRMKQLLRADARRERSSCPTTASAPLSRYHAEHPYVFDCDGQQLTVSTTSPASRLRHVRRQLELARADLVPGQLPDHRVAAEVPPLLRRRLQGRVPDRLGPVSSRSWRSPRN